MESRNQHTCLILATELKWRLIFWILFQVAHFTGNCYVRRFLHIFLKETDCRSTKIETHASQSGLRAGVITLTATWFAESTASPKLRHFDSTKAAGANLWLRFALEKVQHWSDWNVALSLISSPTVCWCFGRLESAVLVVCGKSSAFHSNSKHKLWPSYDFVKVSSIETLIGLLFKKWTDPNERTFVAPSGTKVATSPLAWSKKSGWSRVGQNVEF